MSISRLRLMASQVFSHRTLQTREQKLKVHRPKSKTVAGTTHCINIHSHYMYIQRVHCTKISLNLSRKQVLSK